MLYNCDKHAVNSCSGEQVAEGVMLSVEETTQAWTNPGEGGRYGIPKSALSHRELPGSLPSRFWMGSHAREAWQPFRDWAHDQAGRGRYQASRP